MIDFLKEMGYLNNFDLFEKDSSEAADQIAQFLKETFSELPAVVISAALQEVDLYLYLRSNISVSLAKELAEEKVRAYEKIINSQE